MRKPRDLRIGEAPGLLAETDGCGISVRVGPWPVAWLSPSRARRLASWLTRSADWMDSRNLATRAEGER